MMDIDMIENKDIITAFALKHAIEEISKLNKELSDITYSSLDSFYNGPKYEERV